MITNEYSAALKVIDYLVSLGHTRIGVMANNNKTGYSVSRLKAFQKAMKTRGIPVNSNWINFANTSQYEFAYELAKSALLSADKPTAYFAFTDYYAMAIVNAAKDLSIRVPEDLSVVGFDDLELAHINTPGITTIRQSFQYIGNIACSLLINSINGLRIWMRLSREA